VFASLTEAPALYRADVVSRPLRTAHATGRPAGCARCATARHQCPTAFASRIASSAAGRGPLARAADRHLRVRRVQRRTRSRLAGAGAGAWVQSGGVLAIAHVRGGGVRSRLVARRATRQQAELVQRSVRGRGGPVVERHQRPRATGCLTASRTAARFAAVAAVQRPELFAAAVAQLAITDQFGLVRDPVSAMIARMEDGDPCDPVMSQRLRSWSPYQERRRRGGLSGGARRLRVERPALPGVARPQAGGAPCSAPRRLRVPCCFASGAAAGHRPVGDAAQLLQQADLLAFFADQLGLPT